MTSGDSTDLRRTSVRLAVQFGVVIVVLIGALSAIAFGIVGAAQAESTDRTLVDASRVARVGDSPHDVFVAFSSDGDVQVSRGAPSWFPDASLFTAAAKSDDAIYATRKANGHTYRIRTDADPGHLVQVAIDTGENSEELSRLGLALGISGLIAAAAAVVLAGFMSRRAMRPMVEALALQRRFVMDASHELRTPLTLLSTRAQLLRREIADDNASAASSTLGSGLDDILQDSRELTGILEDLLIAADPRESAEKIPLDLFALAGEATTALRLQSVGAGVELRLEGRPQVAIVSGSRASLLRLFISLISNAIDHAESTVTVEVETSGRMADIRVQDDGPGFSDDMRNRAFERFATSRVTSASGTGTRHYGLGLALVAEVAARHDGSVGVDPSRPGAGAVIRVRIPLSKP